MTTSGDPSTNEITGMALRCMVQPILPWCLFALVFFHAAPSIAGIIQIETKTSATVTDGIAEIEVTATNKGDESAYHAEVHLMVSGKRYRRNLKDLLREGGSATVSFRKIPSPSKAGSYPLITRITFQDINRHPFSAVSCSLLSIGARGRSALECLGKAVCISKNGLLRFSVKNKGSRSHATSATLVLPEELSTPIPQRELFLESGAEETLLFEISNFSALVGAVYPIFCCLEYDSGDAHYTELGTSTVRIVKTENWFRRTRPIWLGLAIVTGVILAACQLKRKGP